MPTWRVLKPPPPGCERHPGSGLVVVVVVALRKLVLLMVRGAVLLCREVSFNWFQVCVY